jgi:Mce-associated membrane protein
MTDEPSEDATAARPVARPKAMPRYQPEPTLPVRPAKVESSRAAKPAKAESVRPAKAESSRPAKVKSPPPAKVKPSEPAEPETPTTPVAQHRAAAEGQPRRRADLGWLKRPATAWAALVAAAAIFAGYALVAWVFASNDSAKFAKARDAVLLDARQDIVVLNQLDYHNIDGGLKHWLDATTGDLHEQLANVSSSDRKDITTAKKVSSGKVIDAAVTELDNRAGTATVIATVETTVAPSNGTPPKRNRFKASMERVDGGWKLSGLDQVAVSMS